MDVVYRNVTEEDASKVITYFKKISKESMYAGIEEDMFDSISEEEEKEYLRKIIMDPYSIMMVALVKDEIVGVREI